MKALASKLWRGTRALILGLLALIGAGLLIVFLTLGTSPGRALITEKGSAIINDSIAGRIDLGKLSTLQANLLRIEGVVLFDPAGHIIARVPRLEARFDPLALLNQQVELIAIEVQRPWVDLSGGLEADGPLRRALAPAQPEATTEPEAAGKPWRIRLRKAELQEGEVQLPPAWLGEDSRVRALRLRGEARLGEDFEVVLRELSFALRRGDEVISEQITLEGQVNSAAASEVRAHVQLGDSTLRAHVRSAGPLDDALNAPLKAQITGSALSTNAILARLGQPEVLPPHVPPLDLQLHFEGTMAAGQGDIELTSKQGALRAHVRKRARRVDLQTRLDQLAVSTFAGDAAPSGRLSLTLDGDVTLPEAAADSPSYPVQLTLSKGRFAGQAIPHLKARAVVAGETLKLLRRLELQIRGESLQGEVRGELDLRERDGPRGELKINLDAKRLQDLPAAAQHGVRGAISLVGSVEFKSGSRIYSDWDAKSSALALDGLQLNDVQAKGSIGGPISAPSGKGYLLIGRLRKRAGITLRGLRSHIGGRRGEFDFQGQTALTLVDRLDGVLEAQGHLSTHEDGVDLDLRTQGTLGDGPLRLSLRGAQIRALSYRVDRLEAEALGVALRASQLRYEKTALTGEVELVSAKLRPLGEALALEPALDGELNGRLQLVGDLSRPTWRLSLRGRQLQRGDASPVDMKMDAKLDRPAREIVLVTDLMQEDSPLLSVNAQGRLPMQGPLVKALREAEYDINGLLSLSTSQVVQFWPAWTPPAAGRAKANFSLHGPLDHAAMEVSGSATLALDSEILEQHEAGAWRAKNHRERDDDEAGDSETAAKAELAPELELWRLDYVGSQDNGGGKLRIVAQLGESGLAQTDLDWSHPAAPWSQVLSDPTALLERVRGRMKVKMSQASLTPFAPSLGLPESLWPLRMSASGEFEYEPTRGPTGALELATVLPRRPAGATSIPSAEPLLDEGEDAKSDPNACSGGTVQGYWNATLEPGRLRLVGQGQVNQSPAIALDMNAALELSRSASKDHGRLRNLTYRLDVEKINLRDVPGLCEYGTGELTIHSQGEDLLGPKPLLTAEFQGWQLRSGGQGGLDLEGKAELTPKQAEIHGALIHDSRRSPFSARLPIRLSDGQLHVREQEPMDAMLQLDRLNLTPLFGPRSPISQASGELSAHIEIGGPMAEPHTEGNVHFAHVSFTASSLSQPVVGLTGDISLKGRSIHIPKLSAQDQDGEIQLSGEIKLPTKRAPQTTASIDVRADEFPARSQGQVAAEVSVDAAVRAVFSADTRLVKIRLDRADMWILDEDRRRGLSMAPHPDLIDPTAEAEAAAAAEGASPVPLIVQVKAAQDFWIKRQDFAVNLTANVEAEVAQEQTSVTGDVEVHRGYVQLLGQTFDLQPGGKVSFLGGQPINPALDLTAQAAARRTSQVVKVKIGGRAHSPELTFLVDESEATVGDAMMALLGQSPDDRADQASNLSGQASSFVAGMLGGLLAVSARRELGAAAPILMIDAGESGSRVRAGFELDELVPDFMESVVRGVYLEGMVGQGNQAQNQGIDTGVLLELYLPHDLIGSGQYGPGNTWSIDFGWDP